MSTIDILIPVRSKTLGGKFPIKRILPYIKKRMVGPFIFLDHMGPVDLSKNELAVLPHPHIGLATITWLFSGEILHRDSLGNEQTIRPGEVNWMTSGRGIAHSERSIASDKNKKLEGLQLWVALPKEKEDCEPDFFHCKFDQLPKINKTGCRITVVAGGFENIKSPVPVYSKLFYLNVVTDHNQNFRYKLNTKEEAAIYVIDGEIIVDEQVFKKFDFIFFKQDVEINVLAKTKAKFIFLGGESFQEGRYIWWNFVSTSQEKIEAAKVYWKNQSFPKVINESSYTPLPDED